MGLPLDPEEIFGVAAVDVFKRVAAFAGCLGAAAFVAALSLGLGEALVNLDPGDLLDWLGAGFLLFLLPFVTPWMVVYFPVVLISGFIFFTRQSSLVRPFFIFLAIESLLIVLAGSKVEWECLASLVMFAGFMGALFWLEMILQQWLRARAESHLMGVTVENQLRREGLRDRFGTDVTDDYFELNDGP